MCEIVTIVPESEAIRGETTTARSDPQRDTSDAAAEPEGGVRTFPDAVE
jgi:hypothetical protein